MATKQMGSLHENYLLGRGLLRENFWKAFVKMFFATQTEYNLLSLCFDNAVFEFMCVVVVSGGWLGHFLL